MPRFFITLILILFSLSAFSTGAAAQVATLKGGDLIKASSAAVYYYGADGKRYTFPDERIFFSWYDNFDQLNVITDAQLAAVPIGGNVTYKPSSRLLKLVSDPKVFWVDLGGTLRHIVSEEIAIQLFGTDWAKKIDDIAERAFSDYRIGPPLLTATLPQLPANLTIDVDRGVVNQPVAANQPSTFNVDIQNFAFTPKVLTVKVGDTIVWTNTDSAPHQVVTDLHPSHTNLFQLNGPVLNVGETYSFTFNQAGIFGYHCEIHPARMTGTIIVEK